MNILDELSRDFGSLHRYFQHHLTIQTFSIQKPQPTRRHVRDYRTRPVLRRELVNVPLRRALIDRPELCVLARQNLTRFLVVRIQPRIPAAAGRALAIEDDDRRRVAARRAAQWSQQGEVQRS